MIHAFKNGQWLPGPNHRDGNHAFPRQPRPGWHFNDVTGAEGATEAEVIEPLSNLLMKQGSFPDLVPQPPDWRGFMTRLETALKRFREHDREFARVTLKPDGTAEVHPQQGWPAPLMQEAARMAVALVRANGQMDYLRRQPWFVSGTHRVVLVLEQEFDRTTEHLLFHQDTTGDALFSNLIFCNDPGLPAPEWSPNLQPMPSAKRERVSHQWPAALLDGIDAERERLARMPAPRIEGGVLPAHAYVSWIDELLWHSTPMLEHRPYYSFELVKEVVENDDFDMLTYDVLVQILQTPGSRLAARLAAMDVSPQAFDEEKARQLWRAVHRGSAEDFAQDLLHDAQGIDWPQRRLDGAWGISITWKSPDGNDVLGSQPSGMLGRPRSNSGNLQALKATPGIDQRRNFMQVIVLVQPVH